MSGQNSNAAEINIETNDGVTGTTPDMPLAQVDRLPLYEGVAKLTTNPSTLPLDSVIKVEPTQEQSGSSNDGRLDKPFVDFINRPDFQRQLREINTYSQSPFAQKPENIAIRATQNSDVVAFGESHVGENPFREFGANILKSLKNNGATHFAIEAVGIPGIKDAIAEFNRTGDIEKLKSAYPPQAQEQSDYFKLLKSARDAGLEIVVADKPDAENRSTDRDKSMADTIKKILDTPRADGGKNKVIFWVGSDHLQGTPDSAAGFLRNAGVNLTTIKGLVPEDRKGFYPSPLAEATEHIDRTTALDSKRFPWLKDIPLNFGVFDRDRRQSEFDHIFLFAKK